MPDKLTDNEIVKALESASARNIVVFRKLNDGEFNIEMDGIIEITVSDIVGVINRLQAQVKKCEKVEHFADKTIATLQAENEDYKALYEGLKAEHIETIKAIKHCKAEAYKECIEKAKNEIDTQPHSRSLEASGERFRIHKILDNLLKELVGEDNESKN